MNIRTLHACFVPGYIFWGNRFWWKPLLLSLMAAGMLAADETSEAPAPADSEVPQSRVRIQVDPDTGEIEVEKFGSQEPTDDSAQDDTFTSFFRSLHLDSLWTENNWQHWSILLAAIVIGVVVGKLLSWLLSQLAKKWSSGRWNVWGEVVEDAVSPVNLAAITAGMAVGVGQLRLSEPVAAFCGGVVGMLILIALFWYAYNLVSVIEIGMQRITARTSSKLDDQMVPLLRKSLRLFIVVVGVLVILEVVFDANVGAALAGFGIAGLAVSLAAQDSLKNLFGSITILFDQPFQVGERIIFQGYDGVVDEIGFRSTKVRLLNGHTVTVPNSAIVNEAVENVARRPSIRRRLEVTITYDTPADKIEEAITIIRDLLASEELREPIHAVIDGEEVPPRVYFTDFHSDSLGIMVMYWYSPPNYWEYLEHAEQFHLALFRRFEEAGIEFAFPTQTLYLAGDSKRELALRMLGSDLKDQPQNE